MKSTLFNMVAVLFTITLVASAGVGGVNMITADAIAEAKMLAVTQAVKNVLTEFDDSEMTELTVDEIPVKVYIAVAGDEVAGYAVETMTKMGFGGAIRMMVGFSPEGEVLNVNVLEQSETPGLGTKMCDDGNALISSVQGKNPADMKLKVKKDGGDVDALTAATISSRAYVDAINRAWMAYRSAATGVAATDTASGATQQNVNEEGGQNE